MRGKYAQTESEREVRVGSPERTRLTEDSLNAPPAAPPPSSADKNNRYDAAPAQKAAGRDRARLGAVELRDLTRDLASRIKGISVVEPTPGELWIQTKAGHRVRLTEAYYIEPDEAILRVDYQATNRHEPFSGMVIAGKYTRGEITLVRSRAGLWTLTHEFYHFLEDIGAIANADKVLLNNKITSLIAKDPKQYAYLKGRSNAEARAEWAGRTLAGVYDAQTPTGKILQKMRDIIDRIVNALGIRTAGGVIRDIRTGQIFEAEEIAANENRRIDAADLYSAMRQGAEPKKTIIAYKLFRVMKTRPGEIFPLFIGKNKPTPMETWIQAEFLPTKGFAARPGWHVGRTPQADHLMKKDGTLPQNRVWAEVEIPADVDWQPEADRQPTRDIQGKPPAGGFYRFRRPVNQGGEWLIAGAMKVNRILSAEEVEQARSRGPDQYALAEDVWQGRVAQPVGRMVAQGVESLIGRGAAGADRMSGWETFKRHWQEFWQPFSSLEGGGTALAARYRAMGDVAKATRFIQDLYGKLSAFPDDVRRDMFWYLDGQIPMDALPEEARDLARTIRERTDTIGEMLVDRGILSEETFAAHQGQYIHYMYAKHVLGEDRPVFLTGTGKLNLTYTKQRNPNLTLQQRKELGLIEDASVAVPVGMGKALTDIAKWDYLASIAANPDWVWQPSVVAVPIGKPLARPVEGRDRRNVRMGIGRLVEEVRTYDAMMSRHPTPEIEEVHRILTDALEQAQEETANAPGNFVQLPTAKTYGPLAGAYVRKPIADDLKPVLDVAADRGRLFNTILEIERQGMALFKMGKVALNLPTAVRNMVSNIIQNNMRGRSLSQIPGDIVAGCESLKAKDAYYEEAFGMGLFHTNWFVTEINDVLDEFRKVQSGRIDQILIALKNLAKYYGRIDDVNKHAIFVQMRKAGHSVDEAALEAMKWGMDYSLTSRSIKGLRQTITPFATYMYKIAPLIAESLKKRPWVLAKFGLIYPAAKALAMGLHGMDDDDWEDLEKQLPSYIKKSGSMMILPWRSDKGQWQWVNLEYFFPWGNYLNIFRDVSKADLGESLRDLGVSNPFLSMFYTGLSAREDQPPLHSYFGTPIYNELDPPPVKAAKLLEFMANTWMPSMLTRQGAIGYTGKMLAGGEDRWGREVSFGQALGRWFGLNIVSVSPEQTRAQAAVKIQDLRKELARIEADPSRSSEEKGAYLQRMNERLGRIAEESPAAVLPITKARGRDPVYDALKDMAARGVLHTGPPSRAVEIGGIPRKMSLEQYRSYLEKSSELARRRLSVVMEGPAWEAMSDRRRSEVVSGIVSNARKGVRQRIKIDIARSERERSGSAAARMQ